MRDSRYRALARATFMAGVSSALLTVAAYAGTNPGDGVRAFGLIGTWSRNCDIPVGTIGSSRIVYEAQKNGHASVTTTSTVTLLSPALVRVGTHFEIDSATLLSDKQIKLVGKVTEIICPGCRNPGPPDTSPRQMIIEKVGAQIHIIDNRLLDGTAIAIDAGVVRGTGQQSSFDNKCAEP